MLVVSCQWQSVVSGQWSVVSGQWSVISGQWPVIGDQFATHLISLLCFLPSAFCLLLLPNSVLELLPLMQDPPAR